MLFHLSIYTMHSRHPLPPSLWVQLQYWLVGKGMQGVSVLWSTICDWTGTSKCVRSWVQPYFQSELSINHPHTHENTIKKGQGKRIWKRCVWSIRSESQVSLWRRRNYTMVWKRRDRNHDRSHQVCQPHTGTTTLKILVISIKV